LRIVAAVVENFVAYVEKLRTTELAQFAEPPYQSESSATTADLGYLGAL
jgi:hypothetical protein